MLFEKGNELRAVRQPALATLKEDGTLDADRAASGSPTSSTCPSCSDAAAPVRPGRRAPRELERRRVRRRSRTRSTAGRRDRRDRGRARCGWSSAVVLSPGWPRGAARPSSTGATRGRRSRRSWTASGSTCSCSCIAEPLILVLGLARRAGAAGPVAVAGAGAGASRSVYTDVVPRHPDDPAGLPVRVRHAGLGLQGVPNSLFFWALVALVLSYGAYVAEVFRAGIESVHPSQVASAEALGLTRGQTMRHVVVPQAVRRVVPPLLNDFVSLQKDTALVAAVGVFDALFAARDYANYNFNYTPYVVVAVLLRRDDRAAGPAHRLARSAAWPSASGPGPGDA